MANQTIEPQPGDVADEPGANRARAMPGEPAMIPDPAVDAAAGRGTSGDGPPNGRAGTQGAAIEDLADPDADANFPDPRSRSRWASDRGRTGAATSPGAVTATRGMPAIAAMTRSATRKAAPSRRGGRDPLGEPRQRGRHQGHARWPRTTAEHPDVSQPANVTQPRRP